MPDHFLNADLDIISDRPLDALIHEIGERALLLHGGPCGEDPSFMARYEMPDEDGTQSPEELIVGFCSLIESLSPEARAIWAAATKRVIDLGYEISPGHDARIQAALPPAILQRMATLGISLAWTLYPPAN